MWIVSNRGRCVSHKPFVGRLPSVGDRRLSLPRRVRVGAVGFGGGRVHVDESVVVGGVACCEESDCV
jgi:hypothetical protein